MPESDNYPWTEFSGEVPTTYALPDYNSVYFSYGFDWTKNMTLGLRITGDFGYARYMSYNIYGEAAGTSLDALMDIEIQPLPFNVNPFRADNPSDATNRGYKVHVFCLTTASQKTNSLENALKFPASHAPTLLTVVLRYYLPTGIDFAGVPLPIIQAFDTMDERKLPLPQSTVPPNMPKYPFEEKLKPIFGTVVDNTLRFYHTPGGGEYNNRDNLYLLNAVDKHSNEVLLLKFQAPTYGHNNFEYPFAEVRYWAFNQGNVDTSTPAGMFDDEFRPAKDGLTYIAIGDPTIADWACQGGYNFMLWNASEPAVILYRNLVTTSSDKFKGSIACVPESDFATCPIQPNDPRIKSLDAKNYIGSYAPTGKKVTNAEFMRNYGGMPSPGFRV